MVAFLAQSAVAWSDAAGVDIVVDKPVGVQENDVMIATIVFDGGYTGIAAPAGWIELDDSQNGADSCRSALYYKVAGAGEPADYTFSGSGDTGDQRGGLIRAYRGVDTTTPVSDWDVVDSVFTDHVESDAPSVTVDRNNSMLICMWTADSTGNFDGETYPASLSNIREDGGFTFISLAGADEAVGVSDSPTGTRTVTHTSTGSVIKGYSIVLQSPAIDVSAISRPPSPLLRM